MKKKILDALSTLEREEKQGLQQPQQNKLDQPKITHEEEEEPEWKTLMGSILLLIASIGLLQKYFDVYHVASSTAFAAWFDMTYEQLTSMMGTFFKYLFAFGLLLLVWGLIERTKQ